MCIHIDRRDDVVIKNDTYIVLYRKKTRNAFYTYFTQARCLNGRATRESDPVYNYARESDTKGKRKRSQPNPKRDIVSTALEIWEHELSRVARPF